MMRSWPGALELTMLLLASMLPGARLFAAGSEGAAAPRSEPVKADARDINSGRYVWQRVTFEGTVARLVDDSNGSLLYQMVDDFKVPVYVRTEGARPVPGYRQTVIGQVQPVQETGIPTRFYLHQNPAVPPRPLWPLGLIAAAVVTGIAGVILFATTRPKKAPVASPQSPRSRLSDEVARRVPVVVEASPQPEAKSLPRQSTEMQWGTLVSIHSSGKSYPLASSRVGVGREQGDLRLPPDDTTVSGSHGAFLWDGDSASYEDSSTNGTLVNGERIHHRRVPLTDGALIQIGRSAWRLSLLAGSPSGKPARVPTEVIDPALIGAATSRAAARATTEVTDGRRE